MLFYRQHLVRSREGSSQGLTDHRGKQVWTRHCPCCGRWLTKHDPMTPWLCNCGWYAG